MFQPDDSFFPLLHVRFWGQIGSDDAEAFVRWREGHRRRALEDGSMMLMLSDGLATEGVPPDARARFAEYGRQLAQEEHNPTPVNVIMIRNPWVRGVMTAIGWLAPSTRKVTTVSGIIPAVAAIHREADRVGIAVPNTLNALLRKHYPEVAPREERASATA